MGHGKSYNRGSTISPERNVVRQASGPSTTSRDTSIAPETILDDSARYASMSTQPFENTEDAAQILERFSAAASLQHPQLIPNDSHASFVDPELREHQRLRAESLALSTVRDEDFARSRTGTPALNGTDGEKKDRKSAAFAANERDLRDLLEQNKDKSLDTIAREVRSAERTHKSERAKQLFAMRWLSQFCKHDKQSTPRNRVYTHYAQRCGTDRVDTLNPASFGKLVRIIFPGIQTRRLGMRGESKYHYVNLALLDDPDALRGRPQSGSNAYGRERANSYEADFEYNTSRPPLDTAVFQPFDTATHRLTPDSSSSQSQGLLFAHPFAASYRGPGGMVPEMYMQSLAFSHSIETSLDDSPLTLPDITPFIPENTDNDLADALTALYRTHCISLIDAVRFVKEKSFFRQLTSFHGTLTVPVSKLFSNYQIAPWVKLCDWMMYQQIIRFVSQLALQVVPPQVFNMMRNVGSNLTAELLRNFQHYPAHLLEAKIEPATIFASLLQRLVRVNETAHAAANLLMNDALRNAMWRDWVRCVRPKRVIESELPNCGYEDVYNILTGDIRQLLEPLDATDFPEIGTEYEGISLHYDMTNRPTSSDGVLERWASFLRTLPFRFSHAHTRKLLHCISAVGTCALRDLTVNQADTFGSWWITKTWIDEMMLWMAESGGFLETRSTPRLPSPEQGDGAEESKMADVEQTLKNGQPHGLMIDFHNIPNLEPSGESLRRSLGPATATFRHTSKSSGKGDRLPFHIHEDVHDDSGIGMSLLTNDVDHAAFEDFPGQHGLLETDLIAA